MHALLSRRPWLANLLVPVLVATVETAAVTPLLFLLGGWLGMSSVTAPWAPLLGLLGLSAFWSTRALDRWDVAVGRARIVSLFLWLLLTLGWLVAQYEARWGFPGAFVQLRDDLARPGTAGAPLLLTIAGTFLAWRRGLAYGAEPDPFPPERLRTVARGAFAILATTILVATLSAGPGGAQALAGARLAVLLGVLAGLLAIAVGQLEHARRQALRRQGRAPNLNGWLLFALGVAFMVLSIAVLLGGVLNQEVWRLLYAPVLVGLRWLATALFYALLAIAFAFFMVLYPFVWLAHHLLGSGTAAEQQRPAPFQPPDFAQFNQQAQRSLPPEIVATLRGALLLATLALVLGLLLSALRRYQTLRHDEEVDEQRESLWSRDVLLGQLRRLVSRDHAPETNAATIELTWTPASVREAYRMLSVLAHRESVGRQPGESASDFARRLELIWPDAAMPLADLTDRYLRVRYGEQPDALHREPARTDWGVIWRTRRQERADPTNTAPGQAGQQPTSRHDR